MPSDSHKRRLISLGGPKPKCKQCKAEKAEPSRNDGLGKSCGAYADKAKQIASEHAARNVKAGK